MKGLRLLSVCLFVTLATCRQIEDLQGLLNAGNVGIDEHNQVRDSSEAAGMIGRATSSDMTEDQFAHDIGSLSQAGIGRNLQGRDDYDSSIKDLLNSFQVDDKSGNVFHHGHQSNSKGLGALGSIEEELFLRDENKAQTREGGVTGGMGPTMFNGNDYEVTKLVIMGISIGGRPEGELTIGLFGNAVPKTVANFVALANHEVFLDYRERSSL